MESSHARPACWRCRMPTPRQLSLAFGMIATLVCSQTATAETPTLFTPGPAETFLGNPALYYWFLDHPDRAVVAWQRLGAAVMPISDRGQGKFGWTDSLGSDVVWETVY